ncbi:MAG: hypothetical protein ABIJ92_03980 [Candidatus Aenigmatarchaeota archaeon]
MKRKAQAAFEYMMIVGIVLLFIVPVWSYMNTVHKDTTNELYFSYARNAVTKIVDTAELVYSQGPPASVQVVVYIPKYVEEINITGTTINIRLNIGDVNDVNGFGIAPLNGSLPTTEGSYVIKIEAIDDYVNISLAN